MEALLKVEDIEPKCSLFRYRCPISDVIDLEHTNSKYSPEFSIGGVLWRVHLQQRVEPQTNQNYLAAHLQCLTQAPGGTYGHFKISVVNRDPEKSKGKNFHCHFKKSGSAWGLHHFILLDRLLDPNGGYIEVVEATPARGALPSRGTPCIVIEILLKVIDPDLDGTYVLGTLPKSLKSAAVQPLTSVVSHTLGALPYPFDDKLCDATVTATEGRGIKIHKCVFLARCPKILQTDSPEGVYRINVGFDTLASFVRYIYTAEGPECRPDARPEGLLELYHLATGSELFHLGELCIHQLSPLINSDNALRLATRRADMDDETLQNMFLRVLVAVYDQIIEDQMFENLPGKLNRRLSMLIRSKDQLPPLNFPKQRHTLSAQLGQLVESAAAADFELKFPNGSINVHRFMLSARSGLFNQTLAQNKGSTSYSFPQSADFSFSLATWQRFVVSMYRGTLLEGPAGQIQAREREIGPEEITLMMKMSDFLGLDPNLRRECEASINSNNCLRLFILSEKHDIPKLKEATSRMVVSSFLDRVKADPGVWDVIGQMNQPTLLSLFKSVVLEGMIKN